MRPIQQISDWLYGIVRRNVGWFVALAVFPSLVGATAITYLNDHRDSFLQVDGTGGAQYLSEEPDEPGSSDRIWVVTPTPSAPSTPVPATSVPAVAPVAPAAPTAAPEPTPTPTAEIPALADVVGKLGRALAPR